MSNSTPTLPTIIAHRGNAAEFPENTLAALASAVELGLRHVELDVHLTADHVPVVIHDADLQRVGGRPDSVHALTWPQLAEIPVGEVDRLGDRFAHMCAPSLAQFVDALAQWEGVTAFVEIKRASLRRFGHELMLRRVAEVLHPVRDRCVLISFDLAAVKILRLMTGARIGWVSERYDEETRQAVADLAPDFMFGNIERIPSAIEALWSGPWDWALYEVRDLATAQRCLRLGARYVETMAVRDLQRAYAEAGTAA
jgi:glycerophosphoryl diester phosphodiesterase